MANELSGKHIAVLATDGVEQVELTEPMRAAQDAGATVDLVSIKPGSIQGVNHLDKGETFGVGRTVDQVSIDEYDGLIIPGGVANSDLMRRSEDACFFVRDFVASGKPVASICHGPWMLVEAECVDGRTLTSWPSLRTDIENAGGTWVDEDVHVDQGIVTSRKPDDLPAFCAKMIEEVREGTPSGRRPATPATAG